MIGCKVAIIDDNAAAIGALQMALGRKGFVEVVGYAALYEQAKKLVLDSRPDLLFLDMELPCYSGIHLFEELRSLVTWPMQVVFYTAYDKYVIDALRVSAFDVLLKPFSLDELDKILDRFQESRKDHVITSLSGAESPLPSPSFLVSTVYGFKVLFANQIGAFTYNRVRRQWLILHVDSSELYLKRSTTAKEILSYSSCFVQINQQTIINVNCLALIKDMHCVMLPPFDRLDDLKISRKYFGLLAEVFQFV
ncbi:response regulator [uncultured Acetobacteroides sp.]|uniref:LytR/AlgR family response regulator transcription factor n=1 Tax=uncultured Acetobacteroides sp. TaxID=1760811 RepID=UPI0029F51CEA|nr:response regulator [uncultured Acetobacteroides sp.]